MWKCLALLHHHPDETQKKLISLVALASLAYGTQAAPWGIPRIIPFIISREFTAVLLCSDVTILPSDPAPERE
jgi:hypothetical protein